MHVLGCAARCLRLLSGGLQLAPAPVELPLQRTRPGTGIHFRPAKFFRARFGRIRPRPLLFEPRPPVTRRRCRYDFGGRPVTVVPDSEIQICAEILVAHRHAFDDSAPQSALSAPLRGLDSMWMMRSTARRNGYRSFQNVRVSFPRPVFASTPWLTCSVRQALARVTQGKSANICPELSNERAKMFLLEAPFLGCAKIWLLISDKGYPLIFSAVDIS